MSNKTDGDAQVPENDLKNSSTVVWREIDPSLFMPQNILVQASILIIACPVVALRCLFKSASSNTLMPAAISISPLNQLQNCQGPLLRLRLRFRFRFSFLSFKGALLANLKKKNRPV
jgi:hypothetical protein